MKGLRPTPTDSKDKNFNFHKLFGTSTLFPDNFNADRTGVFPDQNKDNRPEECTAYAITHIAQNEDGVEYSHDFQYMETLKAMGVPPNNQGADGRTAFQIACKGLLPRSAEDPKFASSDETYAATPTNWTMLSDIESVAAQFARPAYLPIAPFPDYFDAIRSALILGQNECRLVGIATEWSESFEISSDGYFRMSRDLCNFLCGTWGAYVGTLAKLPQATIDQLKARELTLLQVAVDFLTNLLHLRSQTVNGFTTPSGLYWGHMYVCDGWETKDGQVNLLIKPWEGS